MNDHTPHTPAKNTLHPIMVIAAVAVVLFCGVGSAALLGWLPSSSAGGSALAPLPPSGAPSAAYNDAAPAGNLPLENSSNGNGYVQSGSAGTPGTQLAQSDNRAPEPMRDERPAPCNSCGVVESVREVQQRAQGSGAGAAGGAILGGLLGNQVGSGHGRQLATVAGAIGGAVAGNQIEGNMRATHSYTITVRMNDGHIRTFHQSAQPQWRSGDPVKVVKGQLRAG
jgi:outer membrane lipoprotein SlyB